MEKYFKEAIRIIKTKSKRNIISKLKKSKIKEFIKNIFKRKKGKNTNIVLYDELHTYKESEMYNNIIAVTAEEHYRINNNLYKAEYLQNPFEILTEENLERLEKHCKKAIHYERGPIKEEHEVTLCLLYRYQEQQEQIEKQNKELEEKYKKNMNLYEQVKQLFKISDEAMHIFMGLKNRIQITRFSKFTDLPKEKNILCIYKNYKEMNKDLNRAIGRADIEIDNENTILILENGTKMYLKTIKKCKQLDGYRFNEIRFR